MSNLSYAFVDEDLSLLYPLHVEEMLALKHLPKWSYAANEDKKAFKLPQQQFIDAHYYSPQPYSSKRIAIVLDVDSGLDVAAMRRMGMPLPRTFTGRKHSGLEYTDDFSDRPHLVYWLQQPAWMNQRQQADLYNKVVDKLDHLLSRLCWVERINPTTTKNPAKCYYGTEDPIYHVIIGDKKVWELEELSEAIDECEAALKVEEAVEASVDAAIYETVYSDASVSKAFENSSSFPTVDGSSLYVATNRTVYSDTRGPVPKWHKTIGKQFRQHIADEGWHQELFENMRFVAYAYKAEAASESDLREYMLEQCQLYNDTNFAHDPLPFSSLNSTAKSIARWTWRHYVGSGRDMKDRGACRRAGLINSSMSKRKKQQIGGQYAAQKNANKKQQKVFDAVAELKAAGKELVISQLARELSMSRDTVRKYAAEAPEITADPAAEATAPEVAPEVTKTVYIREGYILNNPKTDAGSTLSQDDGPVMLGDNLGNCETGNDPDTQIPPKHMKPPDNIEVPSCLQWW